MSFVKVKMRFSRAIGEMSNYILISLAELILVDRILIIDFDKKDYSCPK